MVTFGEINHFFGYYGINVWNKDKTHILSLETDFNDHLPGEGEKATIGLVNLQTHKIFTTDANERIEYASKYNADIKNLINLGTDPFKGADGNDKVLRPIPSSALDANKADMPQNPGY